MLSGGNYPGQLAAELMRCGRLDEAESALRLALYDAPEDAGLYLTLGECLLARGDRSAALDAFVAAIEFDGRVPAAYRGLGRCELHPLRRYEAFAEALRLAPGCLESELGLAESLIALGRRRQAVERLWWLVSAAPGDLERATAVGELLEELDLPGDAAGFFERAIAEHPIDEGSVQPLARAYRGLARSLGRLGRGGEAAEALEAARYLAGGEETNPEVRRLPG